MICLRHIRALFTLLFILCGAAAEAVDDTQILIVDLYLNDQRMGETFVLQDADGNFYIDEDTLVFWEISKPWPTPRHFRGENYYGVHQFGGATAELNMRSMELRASMSADLMPTRNVDLRNYGLKAQGESFGAFIDYDLNWLSRGTATEQSSYGLFRPVVFGPFGNISANLMYRNEASATTGNRMNVLDLTYTRDNPEKLRSLRIGDVFSNPGGQGRALRMGGIQIATNFSTQPTLITYPLPDFYGQTTVPSALDVYINGRLTRREQVQPGSYVLEDVPVINGLGQMQVVATDALGRQQVFTQDFYLSTELLSEGLSDYSFTLGKLRDEFGLDNFRYGDLAGSATWRYGLSANTTVEGHGEFSRDLAMIGGSVQYGIDSGGTISAGLGLSNNDLGTGTRWQIGFQRLTSFLNYSLDYSGSTKSFAYVGNAEPPPKMQLVAAAGKSFYEYGSLRFSMVHQSLHDNSKRTIWSANYSKRLFGNISMSAYVSYLDDDESDLTAGLRFSKAFGQDHFARGGISTNRDGTSMNASVQRNMPMSSGYGYNLGLSHSGNSYLDAGVAAQNEYGTYKVDLRRSNDTGSAWQVGTQGSIAHLAGVTRVSRQINEAFAVVNVGNIEGVRVYAENLEIGRTNENGQIFVPGLRPYLKNQLRINVDDLPLNARIGKTEVGTAPYYQSGVVVNFDVRVTTNVVLRAVFEDGTPLPEGAIARVFHTNDKFPVGMDGKLFVQGIDRSSEVEIRWNGTVCDIDVPYPSGNAVIAKMGDIVCTPRKEQ